MQRLHQCVLITSVIMGSWLGMQAVHELGHVIGAYATGGKVARVVLYPLTISRTELSENPHPLLVVWAWRPQHCACAAALCCVSSPVFA